MIALAFLGSTVAGLLLVFAIEQLDAGFRSGAQIEQATGVPVLGLLPTLSGLGKVGKSPESYILEHPTSAFSESIRTLYTSILLSRVDHPPKKRSLPRSTWTRIASAIPRFE